MVSPQDFFFQQEVRKIQGRLAAAERQIANAKTVQEVVRLQDVHAPAWLRSVVSRERNALHVTAERKAGDMLVDLLRRVCESVGAEREALLNQLQRDGLALRGHFPKLALMAQQKLQVARQIGDPSQSEIRAFTTSAPVDTADTFHRGPSQTG